MWLMFDVSGVWCVSGLRCLRFEVSGVVTGTLFTPFCFGRSKNLRDAREALLWNSLLFVRQTKGNIKCVCMHVPVCWVGTCLHSGRSQVSKLPPYHWHYSSVKTTFIFVKKNFISLTQSLKGAPNERNFKCMINVFNIHFE